MGSYSAIREWADKEVSQQTADKARIVIGLGTCGIAAGGNAILTAAKNTVANNDEIKAKVVSVGCIGICYKEPLLDIEIPGKPRLSYGPVTAGETKRILENVFINNEYEHKKALAVIGEDSFSDIPSWHEVPFFAPQERTVLRNCGFINPEKIEDYIANDGYAGLSRALLDMTPAQVVDETLKAGLRGRGGAGFPAGRKWNIAADNIRALRASQPELDSYGYVICNADEGDPGAFMNRSVLEGDPHSVIEGMTIAGYAIGASFGYIYCRAEYPLAIERLKLALDQAREKNLLGENILETDFSFDIKLKEGAGAFVCGEETALIASIEGLRGMPMPRPPYPAQSGLWGKPTIINNVETLNNVPVILAKGAEAWATKGTEKSKGTKTFALTGKVENTGLIEVELGMSLRKVIYEIGGGIPDGKEFKAAQTGGPSGGCLPKEQLDLPIDYEALAKAGSIMGSGGLVIMDESTCMVDVARYFLTFTQSESCGKCVPCRLGTKRMLEILTRITAGHGKIEDIALLEELAPSIRDSSLCGLGQSAPNPVLTTLKYFRDEYEAHILEGRCPAGQCKALITYSIDPATCTGCMVCMRACPTEAITGARKEIHVLDPELCTRCDTCRQVCKFDAVLVV
ncbi:MAG: NADH-quinone oxidoreductase subunit NuoF [Anaerolineales bacterium]|uniref:NADH-quinone oxidoreductase subunit NuoF n=1 Tax=Candidatus Desulfolinea nitratireducens TaxID=2841698 RepID=A0A8J6NPS7_9CHLR|nr:NADH-quinone oxidoreductase subunit NuoF [Candidatus Desulfolinea nitratireducens]